jgi:hypothetical protein
MFCQYEVTLKPMTDSCRSTGEPACSSGSLLISDFVNRPVIEKWLVDHPVGHSTSQFLSHLFPFVNCYQSPH